MVNPYKELRIICVGIMSIPWIGPTGKAMFTPTCDAIKFMQFNHTFLVTVTSVYDYLKLNLLTD